MRRRPCARQFGNKTIADVGADDLALAVLEFVRVSVRATILGNALGLVSGYSTKEWTQGARLDAAVLAEGKTRAESEAERAFWIENCNSSMLLLRELCAMRKLARDTVSTDGQPSEDLADLELSKSGECCIM